MVWQFYHGWALSFFYIKSLKTNQTWFWPMDFWLSPYNWQTSIQSLGLAINQHYRAPSRQPTSQSVNRIISADWLVLLSTGKGKPLWADHIRGAGKKNLSRALLFCDRGSELGQGKVYSFEKGFLLWEGFTPLRNVYSVGRGSSPSRKIYSLWKGLLRWYGRYSLGKDRGSYAPGW